MHPENSRLRKSFDELDIALNSTLSISKNINNPSQDDKLGLCINTSLLNNTEVLAELNFASH